MDQDLALATPKTLTFKHGELVAKPLTVSQLAEFRESIPGLSPLEKLTLSMGDLYKYAAQNPTGAMWILQKSTGKKREEIEALDKPVELLLAAGQVFYISVFDQEGDEPEDPKAEGQSVTETG